MMGSSLKVASWLQLKEGELHVSP